MVGNLNQRDVALVTGGARGIGREIALALAGAGADVAIIDDSPAGVSTIPYDLATTDDADETVSALRAAGARAMALRADVRDQAAIQHAVDEVERDLGPVTTVVVAAGVFSVATAATMTDDEWDDVVDTNLHGTYNTTRVTIPRLLERGGGRVLCLVGDEARRGAAGASHVAAASWAIVGLAKSIALETAAAGIAVNVVATGPVETALTASPAVRTHLAGGVDGVDVEAALAQRHPNRLPWTAMEDVVAAAMFLLGAPSTSMTGTVLDVSNGMSALNSA